MGIVEVLNDFLHDAGIESKGPARAGQSQVRKLDPTQREKLRLALLEQASSSNRWMMVWTAVAILIVILDAIIAIRFSGDQKILLAVVGGGTGAFFLVLNMMKSAISSHNAGQTLLAILPNLPPEEWTTIAKVMVTEVLKGSK